MILDHMIGIFTHPDDEWKVIRGERRSQIEEFVTHVPFLAALPALAFYYGVTQVGWQIGDGDVTKLTSESALTLCLLSYGAALVGVWIFAEFINWLADTYSDKEIPKHHGMAMAVYVTAPVFLAGLAGAWPELWFNGAVMIAAAIYAVYLIYEGMPILMDIPKERAFMYSSSVVTIALVLLVSLRVGTVIVWAAGFGPVYSQ